MNIDGFLESECEVEDDEIGEDDEDDEGEASPDLEDFIANEDDDDDDENIPVAELLNRRKMKLEQDAFHGNPENYEIIVNRTKDTFDPTNNWTNGTWKNFVKTLSDDCRTFDVVGGISLNEFESLKAENIIPVVHEHR